MKSKLLALALILPVITFGQTQLDYFEFNESGKVSFNTFANTGDNASSWNFGGPGATIFTTGDGYLTVSNHNGNCYRKIDYSASPYTTGTYRVEIDFTSSTWDAADTDGIIGFSIGSAIGSANNIANISLQANSGSPRIQFAVAETNSSVAYRNWDVGAGIAVVELDLDAGTAIVMTNGVTAHTIGIPSDTSIGALQWRAQNIDTASRITMNSMGFVDQAASGGGDDGGGDDGGGSSDTDLEVWEFGESGNVSFNTFANTGDNASSWNWGGPATVATDGSGFLEVGGANGAVAGGQVFRKIDYTSSPYTSGVYRLEIDFDTAAWGASDTDGNVRFAIGNELANAYNVASITAQANEGSPRIQFFAASTNGTSTYRNVDGSSVVGIIELDLDNSTVSMTTNGVEMVASQPIPAGTTIAAMQFSVQNFDADSSVKADYMKFTQVGSGGGDDGGGDDGGGDDGGGDSGSSDDANNANTDASSIWDSSAFYTGIALEKFDYNLDNKQAFAVGQSWGADNSGSLGSGFNYGGHSAIVSTNGSMVFPGQGSAANSPSMFRTMPSDAGYTDPIDSGVIEFVVDFDSVNLDTNALSTGNTFDIGAFVGAPSANNLLVGVSVNAHTNGQARIQIRSSSTNTAAGVVGNYRSMLFAMDESSLPKVSAVIDLDNDTVAYYTNGVAFGGVLDGIESDAQIDAIRIGMGADGSTNSTVSVDGWALYERIEARNPVSMDGSELSGSSIYITGTNTVLDLTSPISVFDADVLDDNPTNELVNAGQDFYIATAHSAVFSNDVLAASAAAGYTNGGGGRGALVVSTQGANAWQHGGIRIQEQSNNPDYLVPDAGETSDIIVMYKKDTFADSLDSTNVAFTAAADTLEAELNYVPKGRWTEGRFRWVVLDNGSYYASAPYSFTADATSVTGPGYTNVTAEALSISWYAYDPTADVSAFDETTAASPDFDDIGAIGYAMGVTWGDGSSANQWARYATKSFSALGVPASASTDEATAYETWLSDNGLSDGSADGDSDGRNDLLEYALGTDPAVSDSSGISSAISGSNILFVHPKRAGTDHGITYTVETNGNLKVASGWGDHSTVSSSEAGESVSHTIATGDDDSLYIRLKVEVSE